MSTETPETPAMASVNKKHRKNKGNTDNSTKKRKREEEDAPDLTVDKTSEKKRKKDGNGEATELKEKSSKKRKREERESAGAQPEARQAKKSEKQTINGVSVPVASAEKSNDQYFDRRLLDKNSPFVQHTKSLYLPLSPCAYHFPLEGLCAEHISPLLLNYYPPLGGVLLSYENPRMSEHPEDGAQIQSSSEAKIVLSRSIDEYAVTYVWLTAEFLLFKPKRGTMLEGFINLQNESMLGLVCYNYFNAVIDHEKLPKDWRWEANDENGLSKSQKGPDMVTGPGNFVDGSGKKIEGWYAFKVEDFEASSDGDVEIGTVSIFGSLLDGGGKLKAC